MCGRFTFSLDAGQLRRLAGLEAPAEDRRRPRYNVAPSHTLLGIRATAGGAAWDDLTWGIEGPSGLLINARAETAGTRPTFREAFAGRRALVPASGWYEWHREGRHRQPFHFHPAAEDGFLLAALWYPDPATRARVVLLTREAPPPLNRVHHRMPVLVPPARLEAWLDPGTTGERALETTLAADPPAVAFHPVSPEVNKVANDHPGLTAPWEEAPDPQGKLF